MRKVTLIRRASIASFFYSRSVFKLFNDTTNQNSSFTRRIDAVLSHLIRERRFICCPALLMHPSNNSDPHIWPDLAEGP